MPACAGMTGALGCVAVLILISMRADVICPYDMGGNRFKLAGCGGMVCMSGLLHASLAAVSAD